MASTNMILKYKLNLCGVLFFLFFQLISRREDEIWQRREVEVRLALPCPSSAGPYHYQLIILLAAGERRKDTPLTPLTHMPVGEHPSINSNTFPPSLLSNTLIFTAHRPLSCLHSNNYAYCYNCA
ncbi:hypothetical protein ATANTOWER_000869 [Ataeniobius toweri]|uniref:Uncharacterized protein n=1 Tax=Ataeniobius toweri TaxID=208326 RepID=A0ABU7B4S2_9TELE|nr:hypothetical protein [Ataeniobius toweri]